MAIDALGAIVANLTSMEPFFALTDLDENVTLMISASNIEGNSSVLTLTTGHGGDNLLPDEPTLPESLASPSLGPGLLAIIGVCILLVLVLLLVVIVTLCRAKSPEKEEETVSRAEKTQRGEEILQRGTFREEKSREGSVSISIHLSV